MLFLSYFMGFIDMKCILMLFKSYFKLTIIYLTLEPLNHSLSSLFVCVSQSVCPPVYNLLSESLPFKRRLALPALPTECTQYEVHDEEGPQEDEGAEVEPGPGGSSGVLHLGGRWRQGSTQANKAGKKSCK